MSEAIIKKVKALLEKAKTTTEEEAFLCIEKARELMDKYQINESDLTEPVGEFVRNKRIADPWYHWLAASTALMFNCQMIYEWRVRPKKNGRGMIEEKIFVFVGRKSDAIVSDLMLDYFINSVRRKAHEHVKKIDGGSNEWRQFAKGCAFILANRIYKAAKSNEGSKALVLVDEYLSKIDLKEGKESKMPALNNKSTVEGMLGGKDISLNLQATTTQNGTLKIEETKKLWR